VDIIAEPAGLAADFRSMTAAAMDKAVADVRLRLWTPQGARVRLVQQVMPTIEDLTGRRVEPGPRTGDYSTGSWVWRAVRTMSALRSSLAGSVTRCWPPG
jgi:hypothetical protein